MNLHVRHRFSAFLRGLNIDFLRELENSRRPVLHSKTYLRTKQEEEVHQQKYKA